MIKDAAAVDGNGSPTDISKGSGAARPHWCPPGPSARHTTSTGAGGRVAVIKALKQSIFRRRQDS